MVYLTQPRPETWYEAHSICAPGMLMQSLQMPTLQSNGNPLDTAQYLLYIDYHFLQWIQDGVQYLI